MGLIGLFWVDLLQLQQVLPRVKVAGTGGVDRRGQGGGLSTRRPIENQ